MKAQKVKLYGGPARIDIEVEGKTLPFTGVWKLIIEDDMNRTFSINYLVNGSADSISGVSAVMGDWETNDYAIELSAYDENGEDFPVNEEMAKELSKVLLQIENKELKPLNVYGEEVSHDYVMEVVDFIKPKLEHIPSILEGGTIATKNGVETHMSHNDLPRISRA